MIVGNTKTYLILDKGSNLIKIGKAVNVEDRLRQLQIGCGSILEVKHVFDCDIEDILHIHFSNHRKHGEWFDLNYLNIIDCVNNEKYINAAFNERMDKVIRLTPSTDKKISKGVSYLFGVNKWIETMAIGSDVAIPDNQKLSSTRLLCKRYGERTGRRFLVQPKRNKITRIA